MGVGGPDAGWTVDGFDDFVEIGRGGTATVYSALQVALDRRVAVKVLHSGTSDDGARRRFERECSVLGTLGEVPGIVAVHAAAFTSDGRGCIVMRLMEESLADTLRREGPLDPRRVRDIGAAACAGLAQAHARGVVHRDVKPANLLVSESGDVALGDFDIATSVALPTSTVTGDSMSPPHAPPERLRGDDRSSPAGDVWSLGSTLYTLLTDRTPFGNAASAGGMAGLVRRVLDDPVPPIGRPDVPADLDAVLRRAMAKDPADRWAGATEFAAALAAVTFEEPVDERTASARGAVGGHPPTSAPSETTAARGSALTTALVALVVLSAIVVALLIAFR